MSSLQNNHLARQARTLFDSIEPLDVCAAKHGGAPGSREAFERVRGLIGKRCHLILGMVAAAGVRGLTLDEACVALNRTPNTLSPIFTKLRRRGLVRVTGRRPARSGVRANVYVATYDGETALASTAITSSDVAREDD